MRKTIEVGLITGVLVLLAVFVCWGGPLLVRQQVHQAVEDTTPEWEVLEAHSAVLVREPEPAFTDLVQTSLKGVVHLQCPDWQGSGFVVGPRLIATARHCVDSVEDFLITTSDSHQVRATRAISNKKHDVAFIWVDDLTCVAGERGTIQHEADLHPLSLGSIKDCVLGQNVYVIGSPYGKTNQNTITLGIISGLDRDWNLFGDHYGWGVSFTADASGNPGNSGGPLFTMDGIVRGVLVGGFTSTCVNYMPIDLFINDLEGIKLMFLMDKYKREEVMDYGEWYNYSNNSEYY